MDIGKAFSFIFEDPEWVTKILIGGLVILGAVLLSPILVGFFFVFVIMGYGIDLLKNVRDGVDRPLPAWDQWGDRAIKGLKLFVILVVWSLPSIILSVISGIISAIAGNNSDLQGLVALVSICTGCVSFIWGILLALAYPAIYKGFAQTEEISSGFRFGGILAFTQKNLGDIIVAILIGLVAGLVAAVAGTILCLIGLLFTAFWASTVQMHLYGQIARRSDAAPASPSPIIS
jgi:hypothetical protein